MTTLVQRSVSAISLEYYNPKDNAMSDVDAEMCRLFGSLNLAAYAPVDPQSTTESKQPQHVPQIIQPEEDMQMSTESEMTTMTDGEGNVQFIESTPSKSEADAPIEGCGLIQMLCAHYAPEFSHLHCATRDPDFNLLETILAHREAFVAFPFGHRTCSGALTKVAFEIERRHNAGQPYVADTDIDTAIALHNEAWLMSGWYSK
ncbi:uncharacterized protein FOMMEDRAFT_165022 [Fomitiporia mediterranea MF3/22]|uniref:uncharacterized protein n=1 Tax=Fomitiporia mediterranea (strain MF3/22) TaxID=694068 RepID=UPI0004408D06|nr:uncharacterized protein FOMMEDRAFT_165022 [Fomitiporia mediterranea MF3/22]EJD08437.1 hypothetical protein FOMMEDRAFT_165022 [Fomitiporia mediterranea MF3/22]